MKPGLSKIAILGAGSWGTALANHLAKKGYGVTLWMRESEIAESIEKERLNKLFLPGITLSENITPTCDLAHALSEVSLIVSSIPTQYIRSLFCSGDGGGAAKLMSAGTTVVITSKGIEEGTALTGSGILKEAGIERLTVLSGPSFAREVATGLPCAVVAASADPEAAKETQEAFSTSAFRVYTKDDVIGAELGGALKNVVALAAGISDGLGLGYNARAALITRGLAEIARLGVKMGARSETFSGLSGLGDLVLTCTGDLSRNRTVGQRIGSGETLDDIVSSMNMVAEGVRTAKGALLLSETYGVEMPIAEEVNKVLYQGKGPKEAVMDLMTRELKKE